jgi:hypothetical protein
MAYATGTFRSSELSRAVRTILMLLLGALVLTGTVSLAQGGNPEPEPPPIALPPAEPGEDVYIAEVAIESAAQLAALQQLGYGCGQAAACEIEASEVQVSALREAGLAVDIVGLVAESRDVGGTESRHQDGLEEASRYGENLANTRIDPARTCISSINIAGAPASAKVTRVRYGCLVVDTSSFLSDLDDYTLEIRPNSMSSGYLIWDRDGGITDGGDDDDAADDNDIYLSNRWVYTRFDGQPVNQVWRLRADLAQLWGGGYIDYWKIWVYYCTAVPAAPALTAPGNNSHTCDTTPTLAWATVTGAKRYYIQVDDHSSFASPALDTSWVASNYTPPSALARKRWYWRVRAQNECGWGPWSSPRSVTIDSPPGVPPLLSPIHNASTCDSTPFFDWGSATGATGHRIQVDDNATFSSTAINHLGTATNFTPSAALPPGLYYWRVRGQSACGPSAWSPVRRLTIRPGPATPGNPSPVTGATGVPINANLNWADSGGATSYQVYFGTSMTPPSVGTVAVSQYNLPTLSPSTMYYWKIVARNASCHTTGPIWRFRTAPVGANRPPVNGDLAPTSGGAPAGQIVYFTSTYIDPDGYGDLKACRLHIGRIAAPKSLIGNAVLVYQARTNKLLVRNDRGTRWWGGKLVGSANVVQNSQVKAYCDRTTVSRSGNAITVRWAVEFKPDFRGATKTYLKARDLAGLTSPLQQRGTWSVH